jgi:hypothetical protein
MRRGVRVGAGLLSLVVATSCGVEGDGHLQQIDRDDLLGLDETTTSTTTTTTTTPVSVTSPGTAAEVTSTTIATESVRLFFVDGTLLQPVTIDLAGTATPNRVIQALLTAQPEGEIGIGLRTLLPEDLVNDVDAPGTGDVTVDLATEAFNQIDPADQRTAIGQIVMTLVNRPGIGQVRFTLDGVPQRVPRRDGLQSEPGEGVSFLDYESLLDPGAGGSTTEPAASTTALTTAVTPNEPPAGP